MKITLFAKKRTTREGKPFSVYVSKLQKKDGTEQYVTVKYSGDDPAKDFRADLCPLIIDVDRASANLSRKKHTDDEGNEYESFTLWVKDYTLSTEKYVDHSLDDFE